MLRASLDGVCVALAEIGLHPAALAASDVCAFAAVAKASIALLLVPTLRTPLVPRTHGEYTGAWCKR